MQVLFKGSWLQTITTIGKVWVRPQEGEFGRKKVNIRM